MSARTYLQPPLPQASSSMGAGAVRSSQWRDIAGLNNTTLGQGAQLASMQHHNALLVSASTTFLRSITKPNFQNNERYWVVYGTTNPFGSGIVDVQFTVAGSGSEPRVKTISFDRTNNNTNLVFIRDRKTSHSSEEEESLLKIVPLNETYNIKSFGFFEIPRGELNTGSNNDFGFDEELAATAQEQWASPESGSTVDTEGFARLTDLMSKSERIGRRVSHFHYSEQFSVQSSSNGAFAFEILSIPIFPRALNLDNSTKEASSTGTLNWAARVKGDAAGSSARLRMSSSFGFSSPLTINGNTFQWLSGTFNAKTEDLNVQPAKLADRVKDGSATEIEKLVQTIDCDEVTSYTFTSYVKKDSDTTRFPALQLNDNATTPLTATLQINTKDGEADPIGSVEIFGISDRDDYWKIRLTDTTSIGATQLTASLIPAHGSNSGSSDTTATGKTIFFGQQLEKNVVPTAYQKTTDLTGSRNLLQWSESLSSSVWSGSVAAVLANHSRQPAETYTNMGIRDNVYEEINLFVDNFSTTTNISISDIDVWEGEISRQFEPTEEQPFIWLRADKGITKTASEIEVWTDQINNIQFISGTLAPDHIVEADPDFNNKSSVRANQSGERISITGSIAWGSEDLHVFIPASFQGSSTSWFDDKLTGEGIRTLHTTNEHIVQVKSGSHQASVSSPAINDGNPHLVEFQWFNSSGFLVSWVDGLLKGSDRNTNLEGANITGSRALSIGQDASEILNVLDGTIPEAIIFKKILPTSQRERVINYFRKRYDMAIS